MSIWCAEQDHVQVLLLFAVEHPLLGPFLTVVDDNLVVCTGGYDALPIIAGEEQDKV